MHVSLGGRGGGCHRTVPPAPIRDNPGEGRQILLYSLLRPSSRDRADAAEGVHRIRRTRAVRERCARNSSTARTAHDRARTRASCGCVVVVVVIVCRGRRRCSCSSSSSSSNQRGLLVGSKSCSGYIKQKQKAADLIKRYGIAYLLCSLSLSLCSFRSFTCSCPMALMCPRLPKFGISLGGRFEQLGTVGVAYALHKAASPIRFPTVALTAMVAQRLEAARQSSDEAKDGRAAAISRRAVASCSSAT